MLSLTLAAWTPQSATAQSSPPAPTGFLYKTLELDGETYAYSIFVPPAYTPEKAWPVILFLHGSGERGRDGFLQTEVGIGRALRRHHELIPAIVVMPQCRENQTWVGTMARLALRCLEETSRAYHLDPQRIYLTGLSMGGQGAWHIAASLPDRFAAMINICGFAELGEDTGLAAKLAPQLVGLPIWCFHGAQDTNVPVQRGREIAEAVRAAGGIIDYTEYADGTHAIWDRVYDTPEVWRWLFAQKRPLLKSTPATRPAIEH